MPYFSSRNTLYTHAKCKSAVLLSDRSRPFQARAGAPCRSREFPAIRFAYTSRQPATAALRASHVHFGAWLREREEAWTQTNLRLAAEHLLYELQERSLQIAHSDVRSNDQPFNLIELEGMRRIVIIAAVYFTWANDFYRLCRSSPSSCGSEPEKYAYASESLL